MAAANGGGGVGHVRSKSEPVIVPGELQHEPIRAPEGLSRRSVSMDSFDFYFRGDKKADFMESSRQSVMQAVEERRQRRLAFMENLFSRLPEPIDFGMHVGDDDHDEDDYGIDDGASADGDPDVDEDGDDDGASANGDPDVGEDGDDDDASAGGDPDVGEDGDDDDYDEDEDDLDIDGDDDGDGPDVAPAA